MRLEDVVSAIPDYDALRVYSDWLEDNEDIVGAMAVRYLVSNGKWPEPAYGEDEGYDTGPEYWVFAVKGAGFPVGRPVSIAGYLTCSLTGRQETTGTFPSTSPTTSAPRP